MKEFLNDLREALRQTLAWFEERVSLALFFVIIGLGLAWAWSALSAAFTKQPLLYGWSSTETFAVLGVAAIFAANMAYALMKRAIAGSEYRAFVVELMSGPVFAVSALILVAWMLMGPDPKARVWPLASLVAFSAWAAWAHHYGRFAQGQRIRNEGPQSDEQAPATVSRPRASFSSIAGNEAIKNRLREAAGAITARKKDSKPRNGILLHGAPGNGKTAIAEALAGELKLPLVSFGYAEVASQWVGEKTARVRQAFAQAKRLQPCVLFIDEIDSFLEARDGRGDGVKEDRDLVNALLTLMVEIRQHRVILVGATNNMDKLDAAAVREGRFDFKIEITPPDMPARVGLLRKGLRENLPTVAIDDSVIEMVAQRWNGFSVKRILAVTEELPAYMKSNGLKTVGFDDFMGALRQLQGQRGAKPENVKKLADLVLSADTRESLDLIAGRMADPEHTEKHGGTLPTGVLFSGPPGTGKTATCKALASELGWAFLPSTGADLARDPKKLEALYAKAQDLRPAIIFIDEADELVRSREYSANTEATNKLLTLMDGVGDRVRDVVWIAATNHPEQIDPALLRGGRFTEKVRFELPGPDVLAVFVDRWLAGRKVVLAEGITPSQVAEQLGVQSIANVEAILQAAVNRAVARRTVPVKVGEADIQQALRTIEVSA